MHVMSTPTRQKSWQTSRERVSVLAALAVQRETVSRKLAELRELHKPQGSDKPLSQERAAALVGVTGRQWQRWESGESVPYPRNLAAIADHFRFSVSDFFDEESDGVATSAPVGPGQIAEQLAGIRMEFRGDVDVVLERLGRIEERLSEAENSVKEQLDMQTDLLRRITDLVGVLEGVKEAEVVRPERGEAEEPRKVPLPPLPEFVEEAARRAPAPKPARKRQAP